MSQQPPAPGPGDPPGWTPPAGWSPEQPPPWPAPAPPPGPAAPGQPGHGGQPAPPPYGQAPQPGQPYGQPPQPGQPYGQPAPPPYGQPAPYSQPGPGAPPWGWGHPAGQPAHAWAPPPQAPKPGIVPLRPLGIGELLDGALGLIRSNPRTVLGLAATISAISAVVQTVGIWASLAALGASTSTLALEPTGDVEADLAAVGTAAVAQLVPALAAGFLQVLASGLFIVLVGAAVLGRRLDAGQTWTYLRPRLAALVGLTLLMALLGLLGVALAVGLVVLLAVTIGGWAVLPGVLLSFGTVVLLVFAYVRLAVASPALVMERLGPIAALGRSWGLVRGSWWRVAGVLLLSAIITNLLTAIVTVPVTTVAGILSGFNGDWGLTSILAAGVATLLAGIVTLPFSAAVTGLLYTDLRMRREALDIELVSAGVDPTGDPLTAYRRTR